MHWRTLSPKTSSSSFYSFRRFKSRKNKQFGKSAFVLLFICGQVKVTSLCQVTICSGPGKGRWETKRKKVYSDKASSWPAHDDDADDDDDYDDADDDDADSDDDVDMESVCDGASPCAHFPLTVSQPRIIRNGSRGRNKTNDGFKPNVAPLL